MNKYHYLEILVLAIILFVMFSGCEEKQSTDDDESLIWREYTSKQLNEHYTELSNIDMGGFADSKKEQPDAINTYNGIMILEYFSKHDEYDYNKFKNLSKYLLTERLVNDHLTEDLYEEIHIIYLIDKFNIPIQQKYLNKIRNNLDNHILVYMEKKHQNDLKDDMDSLILQQYLSSIYLNYLIIAEKLELDIQEKVKRKIRSNFSNVIESSRENGDDRTSKGVYILSSIDDKLDLGCYKLDEKFIKDLYKKGGFKAHPFKVNEPDIISTKLILETKKGKQMINKKEVLNFIKNHRDIENGGFNFLTEENKEFSIYLTGEMVEVLNLLKE